MNCSRNTSLNKFPRIFFFSVKLPLPKWNTFFVFQMYSQCIPEAQSCIPQHFLSSKCIPNVFLKLNHVFHNMEDKYFVFQLSFCLPELYSIPNFVFLGPILSSLDVFCRECILHWKTFGLILYYSSIVVFLRSLPQQGIHQLCLPWMYSAGNAFCTEDIWTYIILGLYSR